MYVRFSSECLEFNFNCKIIMVLLRAVGSAMYSASLVNNPAWDWSFDIQMIGQPEKRLIKKLNDFAYLD